MRGIEIFQNQSYREISLMWGSLMRGLPVNAWQTMYITQVLPNILPRSQFGGMTVQKGCCMYVCLFWSGQRPVHFLLAYFQGKSTLLSRSFHPWAILPPCVRQAESTHPTSHSVTWYYQKCKFFSRLYLVEHFLVYRSLVPINLGSIGISMIVVIY